VIHLNWDMIKGDIGALVRRYDALPRHIAKKHLLAAMKRSLKAANAVNVLKRNTPKGKAYVVRQAKTRDERGRFSQGSGAWKRQAPGALRRAVTLRSKYIGTNKSGMAVAVVGYKYGSESRKAIWLEFGTRKMQPRRMVDKTMQQVGGVAKSQLVWELKEALDAAVREVAGGRNPARTFGGGR